MPAALAIDVFPVAAVPVIMPYIHRSATDFSNWRAWNDLTVGITAPLPFTITVNLSVTVTVSALFPFAFFLPLPRCPGRMAGGTANVVTLALVYVSLETP